jgi:putative addiction module component (TIGR02574 family)
MSIESIVSGFRELSAAEKIRLVQEFWDEIAEEVGRSALTGSQRQLLDERQADEERNSGDVELGEGERRHFP